jgi:hypothetical protein
MKFSHILDGRSFWLNDFENQTIYGKTEDEHSTTSPEYSQPSMSMGSVSVDSTMDANLTLADMSYVIRPITLAFCIEREQTYDNYLHSIHIILGIISSVEVTKYMSGCV